MAAALQLPDDGMRALKVRFAESQARDPDVSFFTIAKSIMGYENPGPALQLANQMACDPEVEEIRLELIARHGEDHFAITKLQYARMVLDWAKSEPDGRAKAALAKVYAEVRGFIDKPGASGNVDNSVRVIEINQFGTEVEWATSARNQQIDLVADN